MLSSLFDQVIRDYRRLRTLVPLGTLRTKKDYARAVEMLDAILDEVGEDEKHPMAELADAISVCIRLISGIEISNWPKRRIIRARYHWRVITNEHRRTQVRGKRHRRETE